MFKCPLFRSKDTEAQNTVEVSLGIRSKIRARSPTAQPSLSLLGSSVRRGEGSRAVEQRKKRRLGPITHIVFMAVLAETETKGVTL